jgi:hypothetical protein
MEFCFDIPPTSGGEPVKGDVKGDALLKLNY